MQASRRLAQDWSKVGALLLELGGQRVMVDTGPGKGMPEATLLAFAEHGHVDTIMPTDGGRRTDLGRLPSQVSGCGQAFVQRHASPDQRDLVVLGGPVGLGSPDAEHLLWRVQDGRRRGWRAGRRCRRCQPSARRAPPWLWRPLGTAPPTRAPLGARPDPPGPPLPAYREADRGGNELPFGDEHLEVPLGADLQELLGMGGVPDFAVHQDHLWAGRERSHPRPHARRHLARATSSSLLAGLGARHDDHWSGGGADARAITRTVGSASIQAAT